jgi:putative transposase
LDDANGRIQLPKLGWMRYRKSREVRGTPKNVTRSVVGGKVFVSLQTERAVELPVHPSTSVVGLDWGVRRFFTLSNGASKEQLAPLKKFLPRLARRSGV